MSVTLDLPPEVEARLTEEAAKRGLPVSEVVALLVQGFFWPTAPDIAQEWHRQEGERQAVLWKRFGKQATLRERVVEAITQERFLQSQITHEERAIARNAREAILAAQEGEHDNALKAYQRKVLHERKLAELKPQIGPTTAKAIAMREELLRSEQSVHTGMIDLLRMKINRQRAEIRLGKSALERVLEDDEATQIRNHASEESWKQEYQEWIAANQDAVCAEVPSDIDVLQQVNEQNQQQLENLLQRVEEINNRVKPSDTDEADMDNARE